VVDRRSIGKALAAWRSELPAHLGGIKAVSTQELALVEKAVKSKLILDSRPRRSDFRLSIRPAPRGRAR
jgi:hypothetical protein